MASDGIVEIHGQVVDGLKAAIGRRACVRMSSEDARLLAVTLLNLADSADTITAEQNGQARSYGPPRTRWVMHSGGTTISKVES